MASAVDVSQAESVKPHQGVAAEGLYRHRRGVGILLTAVDHKTIGLMYGGAALTFFLLAGLAALVMRMQLALPAASPLPLSLYDQLTTVHGTAMLFLVLIPLGLGGFGNYLVPLMIGARDLAFPRLGALAFWLLAMGGIALFSGFATGAAAEAGWTGYPPLSTRAPGLGQSLWSVCMVLVALSTFLTAVNLVSTIWSKRAAGLGFDRLPVFVWTIFVAACLQLVAMPVLALAMVLLLLDRHFGTHIADPASGGSPLAYLNLFWFGAHPAVYSIVLPFVGIVSEVLPVFSRKPLFSYRAVTYGSVAFGALALLGWGAHLEAAGLPSSSQTFFAANTLLAGVPLIVIVFTWLATVWGGHLTFRPPLLFAFGCVAFLVIGGASGVIGAVAPLGLQLRATHWEVAHLHYVLVGGGLCALFAGLYYWFPKASGRLLDESLGRWHFWLLFLGLNVTFLPMYLLGLQGMQRRVGTYAVETGFLPLNALATVGAFVTAGAICVFFWNLARSWKRGPIAGNDPWLGNTLEWLTMSPPPPHNFTSLPAIHSERPLRDIRLATPAVTVSDTSMST